MQVADYNMDGYQDIATGEFNNHSFFYHAASSHIECGVAKGSNIELTANFSASTDTLSGQPTEDKYSESSGGTFSFMMMSLLAISFLRRRATFKTV